MFKLQKNLLRGFTLLIPIALLISGQLAQAQQATLDGNVVNIPVVVFGDLFYEIQLGLVPDTNPPELALIGGEQVFNKESEVEYKTGVNGTWTITEDVSPGSCEFEAYTDSYELDVVRDGDALSVSTGESVFSGTINGNSLDWSGMFEDEQEESSLSTFASVTFSPDEDSITGSSSWTLTLGEESCSGTTSISGELTTPEEVPYEEVAAEDPTMPYVLNSVDQSATEFDGLVLSIPSITVDGVNFWADLELVSDNPVQFKLIGSGFADVQMGLLWNENEEHFNGAVFYNENIGRVQINFNPETGLLHDALIEGEYYIFTNYTATTVDIIYVELDNPPVILIDIPLTDNAKAYVEEMTSAPEAGGDIQALSLRPSIMRTTSILAAISEQDSKRDSALDWVGKGLAFVKDVFDEASERESYKIPDLTSKIVRDHAKSYGKKVIRDNIDTDALDKIDIITAGLEAAKTKVRCLAFTPTLDWALACADYIKNYKEINANIDAAVDLGHIRIKETQQRKIEAHYLKTEVALGCDASHIGNDDAKQDCVERLGDASGGKTQPILDTDRNNNGTSDFLEGPKVTELGIYQWLDRMSQANVHGEDVSFFSCNKEKLTGSGDVYTGETDRWWWGCKTKDGSKTGTWTEYWQLADEIIEVQIITYKSDLREGDYWSRDRNNWENALIWESGQYVNDEPDGEWLFYHQDALWKVLNYKNGVVDGDFFQADKNDEGTYTTGQYVNGKRHGTWEQYIQGKFDNLSTWENGEQAGPFETWRPDGFRDGGQVGQYSNGRLVGELRIYEDNELSSIVVYDDQGGCVSQSSYDLEGNWVTINYTPECVATSQSSSDGPPQGN